ncbi:Gfo/Idh/MocA family oxidoreductase [Aurantimonas sp. C2-6-R+9]|uniref:Gfo/Idh/MocA family protein n=1 Tax=unclassified Aurantimonas TaxID=2638230 RepID=UPI002E1870D5|nr:MULTISPECIES: Gfo/Idh/MocA family oxidoreductase [unclassified Aurantimonas]MEC5293188.1 Gfo/Idh/MocA family oxidoreductase [Aurantimonas sp. C2-3-R2]MEC5383339.1 Gfo/Idh/MocA family oxidoreductase [Aurantimonas sp. C2-6-R+9]MEC5414283.1 Gfo/Idh/MocA family oxidoreductase [Aurantimonas sp. C2-4-R8]
MSPPAPLRMGFCGAGWVVRNCYRPALEALGGRIVVAVVLEPAPAARATAQDLFPEAMVVSTREDLLAAPVEAIVVASPNPCHVDDTEAFLSAGLACLVEKPVLRGTADRARLTAAGRRGGAALAAGVACRHRPDVRRWLEGAATIGPLRRLDLTWHRHRGVPATAWHLADSPGWTGVFADLGSHLVDLAGAALGWRTDGLDIRFARQSRTGHTAPAAWYDGTALEVMPSATGVAARFEAELRVADCVVHLSVRWLDDTPGDVVRLDAIGDDGACRLHGLFGFSTERRTPHQRVTLRRRGKGPEIDEFTPGPALHVEGFVAMLDVFHHRAAAGWREEPDLAFAARLGDAIETALR